MELLGNMLPVVSATKGFCGRKGPCHVAAHSRARCCWETYCRVGEGKRKSLLSKLFEAHLTCCWCLLPPILVCASFTSPSPLKACSKLGFASSLHQVPSISESAWPLRPPSACRRLLGRRPASSSPAAPPSQCRSRKMHWQLSRRWHKGWARRCRSLPAGTASGGHS